MNVDRRVSLCSTDTSFLIYRIFYIRQHKITLRMYSHLSEKKH